MEPPTGASVVGIYIDVSGKLGPEGSPICLVKATPAGTLILTSPYERGNLSIVLNHLNMTELQWLMDAISQYRKTA